jgi:hypothetical protein
VKVTNDGIDDESAYGQGLVNESDPIDASGRVRFLSTDQCQRIFLAAIQVLSETGIVIRSPQALDILAQAGVRVEGARAYLPESLIEHTRHAAPGSLTLYSPCQDGSKDLTIDRHQVHYGPSITATHFLDPRTGERRAYVRDDAASVARVCDALPNIEYVAAQGTISDVHPDLVEVYEFAALVSHSANPVMAWADEEGWRDRARGRRLSRTCAGMTCQILCDGRRGCASWITWVCTTGVHRRWGRPLPTAGRPMRSTATTSSATQATPVGRSSRSPWHWPRPERWTAPTRSPPPVWGEAEIEDKFRWLAAHVLEQGRIQTLVDTVRHFEDVQDVQDVRDLTTSLAGQAR